jgi:hypothetical protein
MTFYKRVAVLQVNIESLHATAVKDGENIRELLRIVELRERRLNRVEDSCDNR